MRHLKWILATIGLVVALAAIVVILIIDAMESFDESFLGPVVPVSKNPIQRSGITVTEERQVSGFDAIQLSGPGHLTITQASRESLTIWADRNVLPLIRTAVHDGTLYISIDDPEPGRITQASPTFNVLLRSLRSLSLFGPGADADMYWLVTDDLWLSAADSSSYIRMNSLQAESLRVSVSYGWVSIAGRVDRQDVGIEGHGEYQARELASRSATVRVRGNGHAVVQVSDSLDATVNGLGSVEYIGQPTLERHGSGSDRILEVAA